MQLYSNKYWPEHIEPTEMQWFILSLYGVKDILLSGNAGWGKTVCMLLSASYWVGSGQQKSLLLRRKYTQANQEGGVYREAKLWWDGNWGKKMGIYHDKQAHRFEFPEGDSITFGHIQYDSDMENYYGGKYTHVYMDELTQVKQEHKDLVTSRQRIPPDLKIPTQFLGATNPGGQGHEWVKAQYELSGMQAVNTRDRMVIFGDYRRDNEFIDPDHYDEQLDSLEDAVLRKQLKNGDWDVNIDTGYFDVNCLKVVGDSELAGPVEHTLPDEFDMVVRSWDTARTKDGGDFTVGSKIGKVNDEYYILEVERFQEDPFNKERRIFETAQRDGSEVEVLVEQGISHDSVDLMEYYDRKFSSMGIYFTPIKPTSKKEIRAELSATLMGQGKVYVVQYDLLPELVDEFRSFPEGNHDDQVDSISQGINYLAEHDFALPFMYGG